MVFIQGTRFTRGGGTNKKGAAGSGRFKVGKQGLEVEGIRDACPIAVGFLCTGWLSRFLLSMCKRVF